MSLLPVYTRHHIDISHGQGSYLYAKDGTAYLDFATGVAVNAFGHCHPRLVKTMQEQAEKLWHVSNLFKIPQAESYAKMLTDHCFADYIFFGNSGTEAIECLIKMVRKYHHHHGNAHRHRIITFTGAFHGRSLAAAWAGKQNSNLQEGFGPAIDSFDQIEFGNSNALEQAITPETGAILIEPIQGEGGINVADNDFLQTLRAICTEKKLLLCFDEIQCGMGRAGKLFAHEYAGITPDIMASAKGLGGGFPLGACLATKEAAIGMTKGTHGSTYGGNPMAMAIGSQVLEMMLEDHFLEQVQSSGDYFKTQLSTLQQEFPQYITAIKGKGLMLGLKLTTAPAEAVGALMQEGLLTVPASDNVIRLLPPLNVKHEDIDKAITMLKQYFLGR